MDLQWIVTTIAIFLAGAGLGFLLGTVFRKGDNSKLADKEAELAAYKRDVTEHFGQSAEHFRVIGSHYKKLYEHMAAGSDKLCDTVEANDGLQFPRPADVAIESPTENLESRESASEEKAPGDYADSEASDQSSQDQQPDNRDSPVTHEGVQTGESENTKAKDPA